MGAEIDFKTNELSALCRTGEAVALAYLTYYHTQNPNPGEQGDDAVRRSRVRQPFSHAVFRDFAIKQLD